MKRFCKMLALLILALGLDANPAPTQACPKVISSFQAVFACAQLQSANLKAATDSVEITSALLRGQNALRWPSLFASASYEASKILDDSAATLGYDSSKRKTLGAGLRGQVYDLGLTYEATLLELTDGAIGAQTYYQSGASASATIHLWKDFGPKTKLLPFRGFAIAAEASKVELDLQKESLARQTLNLYLQLLVSQKREAILESSSQIFRNRLSDYEKLEALGNVSGINILSFKEQLLRAQTRLDQQKQRSIELKSPLCSMLKQDFATCTLSQISDFDFGLTDQETENILNSSRQTYKANLDYLQKKSEIEELSLAADQAKNELDPSLDLTVSRSLQSNYQSRREIGWRANGYDDVVELVFAIPMDQSVNRLRIQQKQSAKQRAERQLRELELRAQNDFAASADAYKVAKQWYAHAIELLENSQKRVTAAKQGQKLGTVSVKDLVDYEAELQEAQISTYEASSKKVLATFEILTRGNRPLLYSIISKGPGK